MKSAEEKPLLSDPSYAPADNSSQLRGPSYADLMTE